MHEPQALLDRLDAIGAALAGRSDALALLGLGSVGVETGRLDHWSDLDFFAIVRPGAKPGYLADIGWLAAAAPVAWSFVNSADGRKALFADGIYAEYAVFEPQELERIPFNEGRLVWSAADFDAACCRPRQLPGPPPERETAWLVGEAVTCLYVGLCRYRRGEKLSAQRFVQHYAVDRIVDLAARIETERPAFRDPFSGERRFEERFPGIAAGLPGFVQGYDRTPESAGAILAWLAARFPVDPALAREIELLILP